MWPNHRPPHGKGGWLIYIQGAILVCWGMNKATLGSDKSHGFCLISVIQKFNLYILFEWKIMKVLEITFDMSFEVNLIVLLLYNILICQKFWYVILIRFKSNFGDIWVYSLCFSKTYVVVMSKFIDWSLFGVKILFLLLIVLVFFKKFEMW